jgi:prevent-host-death family protein
VDFGWIILLTNRGIKNIIRGMKTLMVDEFKRNISEVLEIIKQGEEVTISSGKEKENIAVLIPFDMYIRGQKKRKLGILESRASYSLKEDFEMSDEELLSL